MNNSNDKFSDPFASLGVSVQASELQIKNHYRNLVKLLHPDSFYDKPGVEKATELLTKIVNPAYQKLKKESSRKEILLGLKSKAELKELPVETLYSYEIKLKELSSIQYQNLDESFFITEKIEQLNLAYLSSKGTSLNSSRVIKLSETVENFRSKSVVQVCEPYDQKHYKRAKQYASNDNWSEAISELKGAIKINPEQSQYHSLLGFAYLNLKMKGMARAYFKRALQVNPNDALALRYLPQSH